MKTTKDKVFTVKQVTTGVGKTAGARAKAAKSTMTKLGLQKNARVARYGAAKLIAPRLGAAKAKTQNATIGKAIRRLELLGSSLENMDVVITDTSVIVKPRAAAKTNYTTPKSILRGAVVSSSYSSIVKEHHKAMATLVKQSSLETETAISTLKHPPSAADKDFFAEVKLRALGLRK